MVMGSIPEEVIGFRFFRPKANGLANATLENILKYLELLEEYPAKPVSSFSLSLFGLSFRT